MFNQKISKSLRRGGINWELPFPEGEVETSMSLHREAMKSEWKKRSPRDHIEEEGKRKKPAVSDYDRISSSI